MTLLGLAACGGSSTRVAVDAPKPAGDTATGCAALISQLPAEITPGEHRRQTTPKSPYTAAYGDPPVLVRCGAPIPRYEPTASVLSVEDVDWLLLPGGDNSQQRFLAYHSDLRVEVTVTAPQLPANVLPPISKLIPRG